MWLTSTTWMYANLCGELNHMINCCLLCFTFHILCFLVVGYLLTRSIRVCLVSCYSFNPKVDSVFRLYLLVFVTYFLLNIL
jgi:hypothetical protein